MTMDLSEQTMDRHAKSRSSSLDIGTSYVPKCRVLGGSMGASGKDRPKRPDRGSAWLPYLRNCVPAVSANRKMFQFLNCACAGALALPGEDWLWSTSPARTSGKSDSGFNFRQTKQFWSMVIPYTSGVDHLSALSSSLDPKPGRLFKRIKGLSRATVHHFRHLKQYVRFLFFQPRSAKVALWFGCTIWSSWAIRGWRWSGHAAVCLRSGGRS